MNSRSSRSHRSFPGSAYGAGLSSSYGSGLGTSSAGYSFSSGYSPSYTSYSGYLTGASRPGYSTAPSLSPGYNTGSKYSGGGYTAASLLPPTATSSSSYTSKRYTGAKTDSDLLTNGLGATLDRGGSAGSPWRSKSTDPALTCTTNGYRERSLSRDPSNSFNYEPSGDGYAALASRASAARDHYHHLGRGERSPSSRDFTSSRDCRASSFSGGAESGTDGLLMSPLAPPRVKKPVTSTDYQYRSTPPLAPAYDSASRFSNATASLYRPSLSRSNSFHDLREGLTGLLSPTTPKAR
jgi:hypothetical protein